MNENNKFLALVAVKDLLLQETKEFIAALERGATSDELGIIRHKMKRISKLIHQSTGQVYKMNSPENSKDQQATG